MDREDLDDIRQAIEVATDKLKDFETVGKLEENLGTLFAAMSGPKQDIQPRLGFGATDVMRLYRSIRLLIDGGRRTIADASLGSANIVFLTLKTLELKRLIDENGRDHTFLAIEEPEAHLHPHLQRSVYRHFFEVAGAGDEESPLSILLTTHSTHIASVAPLRSILLLRATTDEGTVGFSTAGISLTGTEEDDLTRYLDVTRAEMLFARGIILVEGDAEKFLLPVFAETIGLPLDRLGITVCSVSGTNFQPYAKFLAALRIPFTVVTDWDPRKGKQPLGFNRAINLVKIVEHIRTGSVTSASIKELETIKDDNEFRSRCEAFGVFVNVDTLEVDLFNCNNLTEHVIDTLREQKFSAEKQKWIDEWESDPESLYIEKYIALIETIGKGRFAQRLASRIAKSEPPSYIKKAIEFVVSRA